MSGEVADELARARLDALFHAHHVRLFALALRLTGCREAALEVVQETFLRAARHVGAIPPLDSAARGWLTRVLVNVVRDDWRRRRVRLAARRAPADSGAAGSRERDLAVREALAALAPKRRTIVVLAELEGRTSSEIAALLGMHEATVRWHLGVARRRLRAMLRPWVEGEGPEHRSAGGEP